MALRYYIRRFFEIPGEERRLFLYGLFVSSVFFFITHTIHFRFYRNLLSRKRCTLSGEEENSECSIKMLKRTLNRITKAFPWELTCLIKGITFKILANSLELNCTLSFDALKLDNGSMIAHSFISRKNKIIYLEVDPFRNPQGLINII